MAGGGDGGLGELVGGTRGQRVVDDGRQPALLVGAEPDPAARRRPAAGHQVRLRTRQRQLDRPPRQPGGGDGEGHVRPGARLAAEPAPDVRRQHVHPVAGQAELLREHLLDAVGVLRGVVHGEVVAVPRGHGGVRFERVVVLGRRAVDGLHGGRGPSQSGSHVPNDRRRLLQHRVSRGVGGLIRHRQDGGLWRVAGLHEPGGVFSLLLRLGHDDGDRLAVPEDAIGIQDRQAHRGGADRCPERGVRARRSHRRRVLVRHHQQHAGRRERPGGVDGGDAALGDRAGHRDGVSQPGGDVVGGVGNSAGHFRGPVEPVHVTADLAGPGGQGVVAAVGQQPGHLAEDFGAEAEGA